MGVTRINDKLLSQLPPLELAREYMKVLASDGSTKDMPLGEIFPELAANYYGRGNLSQYRDILPVATAAYQNADTNKQAMRQAADKPGNPAAIYEDAFLGGMSNSPLAQAIMAKIAAGQVAEAEQSAVYGASITSTNKGTMTAQLQRNQEVADLRQPALSAPGKIQTH